MNIARACARATAAFALPLCATASAGDLHFDVVRLDGSVARESEQSIASLRVAEAIGAGERVRTGTDGHAVLQLPPVGAIALGTDAALFVHSLEAEDLPARSGLARLVLEYGAARISARSQQLPPADLRINMGALKLRVLGAEIWVERSTQAEEVCLLSGAIELQGAFGSRRLDEPGHCLRSGPSGLQEQDANSAGAMAPRLTLTAFPGDPTMQWVAALAAADPRPAAAAAPGSDPGPGLDPVPNAATETPAPETTSPLTSALNERAGGWTIVLASLPEAAAAEKAAERLRASGLDVRVLAGTRADGAPTYRVISGQYASKSAAAPDIQALRARRGLRSAWIAPLNAPP